MNVALICMGTPIGDRVLHSLRCFVVAVVCSRVVKPISVEHSTDTKGIEQVIQTVLPNVYEFNVVSQKLV